MTTQAHKGYRLDMLDQALLRPGHFGVLPHLHEPSRKDQIDYFS